jgi:hypothetical protein
VLKSRRGWKEGGRGITIRQTNKRHWKVIEDGGEKMTKNGNEMTEKKKRTIFSSSMTDRAWIVTVCEEKYRQHFEKFGRRDDLAIQALKLAVRLCIWHVGPKQTTTSLNYYPSLDVPVPRPGHACSPLSITSYSS